MANSDWLHLFTSTIRELYIADALGVLAAPQGGEFRYRYSEKHVQQDVRQEWKENKLINRRVALHFSLQHPKRFYAATYVPLRTACVVETGVEGLTYLVRFRLGQYSPLGAEKAGSVSANDVREYTSKLGALLDHHPDGTDGTRASATVGPNPSSLFADSEGQGAGFETVVRYLDSCLYFAPRTFFRVVEVTDDANDDAAKMKAGILQLTAGHRYSLKVAHYQPEPLPADTALQVTVPDGVELLGVNSLPLHSRYDVVPIRIFAKNRDDVISAELRIETTGSRPGPEVRLPLVVAPSGFQVAALPLLGIGGAIALALPPILASDTRLWTRIFVAAFGTLLVGVGAFFRRRRGLGS